MLPPTRPESGVAPFSSVPAMSAADQFLSLNWVILGTPPWPSGLGPPVKRRPATTAPSALRGE